jgi:AAA+ superfamily predicted ATPase
MSTTVRGSVTSSIVALLGTINSTASMVANTVEAASGSVDILDRYVKRINNNQVIEHKIADRTWRSNLIKSTAKEQEEFELKILKTYGNDQERSKRFVSIVSDLESIFAEPEA